MEGYSNRSKEEWNKIVLDICKVKAGGKHSRKEDKNVVY